ncbi:hypothetical protein ACFV80_30555 [Streptomyces sp. NPDC059862]|uniref:hypothetical protein n=1 Tax=Streptomyces sp. NPDC059862 TaxID=3346975 RepID=UPI003664AA4E
MIFNMSDRCVRTAPPPAAGEYAGRGSAPGGVTARVLQRILARTAAIWHTAHTGRLVLHSLTAYDH